ncbi:MAG: peptidylprolyl isomerase [Anaerolineaceae bacterium]
MAKREQPKILTKKHLARVERERRQNRWIVISASIILLSVVGLVGYGVLDQTVLQKNKPVIKVGEDNITVKEFQKQVSFARAQKIMQYNFYYQLSQSFGAEQFSQTLTQLKDALDNPQTVGSEVMDNLENDLLIRQEAAKRGITVTADEVEQKMREMYGFYPEGTPTPSQTPTSYSTPTYNPTQLWWSATRPAPTGTQTATPAITGTIDSTVTATLELAATLNPTVELTATQELTPTATEIPPTATSSIPTATATIQPTNTPFTLEGYTALLAKNLEPYKSFGYTEADYRKSVESELLKQKLSEAQAGDGKHESVEVWARHILVPDETTANIVLQRLKSGEDFYNLAATFSTDESNKNNGGDLGWFGKGQMVPEFETAAFALTVGQISEPVKTSYGVHIIQLLGKRIKPLNDYEWSQYIDTLLTEWLTKQKSDRTDIQRFDIWSTVVPTEPTFTSFGQTN